MDSLVLRHLRGLSLLGGLTPARATGGVLEGRWAQNQVQALSALNILLRGASAYVQLEGCNETAGRLIYLSFRVSGVLVDGVRRRFPT